MFISAMKNAGPLPSTVVSVGSSFKAELDRQFFRASASIKTSISRTISTAGFELMATLSPISPETFVEMMIVAMRVRECERSTLSEGLKNGDLRWTNDTVGPELPLSTSAL